MSENGQMPVEVIELVGMICRGILGLWGAVLAAIIGFLAQMEVSRRQARQAEQARERSRRSTGGDLFLGLELGPETSIDEEVPFYGRSWFWLAVAGVWVLVWALINFVLL